MKCKCKLDSATIQTLTEKNSVLKYLYYFLIIIYMSGGHDDHGDKDKKSGGKSMDFGITSMIGGFFGVASGAGAVEAFKNGGGSGGGWHDHH